MESKTSEENSSQLEEKQRKRSQTNMLVLTNIKPDPIIEEIAANSYQVSKTPFSTMRAKK